jgi:hypothetical protein
MCEFGLQKIGNPNCATDIFKVGIFTTLQDRITFGKQSAVLENSRHLHWTDLAADLPLVESTRFDSERERNLVMFSLVLLCSHDHRQNRRGFAGCMGRRLSASRGSLHNLCAIRR